MRALLAVALLLPAVARAELSETERNVIVGGLGVAVGTYSVMSTVFMVDQLLKQGWSEPKHIVPSAFLAGVSLVSSVAAVVVYGRARDEIGIVGSGMAALSSAAMCFLVTLAIHGYAIHHPNAAW